MQYRKTLPLLQSPSLLELKKTEKVKKSPGIHLQKVCCIKTCMGTNRTVPKRRFFVIPSVKVGQGQKRERWISAIRKINGQEWKPKITHLNHGSKVCSAHFTSGNHSLIQWDEDYVPHIFHNEFDKYKSTFKYLGM